jgi:anti-sigma factor RsiW
VIGRRPLSCRELVELVTDYLEGALPRRERRRFEQHIGGCDACSEYLQQMRLTIEATGRLDEESVPAAAREALLHAFRDWNAARPAS